MDIISIIMLTAILGGFYLAWSTGANDVANAIGPSVGSGALTLNQAVGLAIVFEFIGAWFAGGSVTYTVTHGMIPFGLFEDRTLELALGMTCGIVSSAVWLNVSTWMGWPISMTHCVMGGLFGVLWVLDGLKGVNSEPFLWMGAAWIVTPLLAFTLSLFCFRALASVIYGAEEPVRRMVRLAPHFSALITTAIAFGVFFQGEAAAIFTLNRNLAAMVCGLLGLLAYIVSRPIFSRLLTDESERDLKSEFDVVDKALLILQIPTACFLAFAHGSNDIANAVGPVSAVFHLLTDGHESNFQMTKSILLVGAVGIVIGLVTFGARVVATVGKQITQLTAASSFVATFCAGALVLCSTKMGVPVSTTHIVVGAIVGVGSARAVASIDQKVIREIFLSWLVTVPITALLSGGAYLFVSEITLNG